MKVLAGPASYKQQIKNFKATLVATSTAFVAAKDRDGEGWIMDGMQGGTVGVMRTTVLYGI